METTRIDGKEIAEVIIVKLKKRVVMLTASKINPTLVVILVGDNPASLSYIKQKQRAADRIGIKVILEQHEVKSPRSPKLLRTLIKKYNSDSAVHGIIVQRPLPDEMGDQSAILNTINPAKDVDGFVPGSAFEVPVSTAVVKILQYAKLDKFDQLDQFVQFLKSRKIVVIGRGETAGAPIARLLTNKYGCQPEVVHSRTPNPDEVINTADIVISCVGKARVLHTGNVKPGSILISVGIWRDNEGKLHGDYEEDEIAGLASAYTPTPGGVGPVNVACLMENVLLAAQG